MNARAPALRNQMFLSFVVGVLGMCVAWEAGNVIVAGNLRILFLIGLGLAGCAAALAILQSWRTGFYLFLGWLLFEDLVRKYMGNGAVFFFGKDVLVLLVYISFIVAVGRGREKAFRPPFLLFFSLFFWLGVLQMFNPHSPHILYGLLGIKVYFYYVPLLFVGYALIRNDGDLRKFLVFNAVLAGVIAMLGIAQAILGNSFLNPAKLDPNLADLGNLSKMTPLSNQVFSLPDSVFVSTGRFALYVVLAMILMIGAAAYFLLSGRRHRKLIFAVIGVLAGAALLSGSRSAIVGTGVSVAILVAGFLWGAQRRKGNVASPHPSNSPLDYRWRVWLSRSYPALPRPSGIAHCLLRRDVKSGQLSVRRRKPGMGLPDRTTGDCFSEAQLGDGEWHWDGL